MKKIWYLLVGMVSICTSCSEKEKTAVQLLAADKPCEPLTGSVLLTYDSTNYVYDMKIQDNWLAVLDNESDTLLRIYSGMESKQVMLSRIMLKNKELIEPAFIRSDMNERDKTELLLVDASCLKKISWASGTPDIRVETSVFSKAFRDGYNYNMLSGKRIYGVTQQNPWIGTVFFAYEQEDGYQWMDADERIKAVLQDYGDAYLGNLSVNEKKQTAAFAHRYVNGVQFYNLAGKEKQLVILGDSLSPLSISLNGRKFDEEHTQKYFIQLYGTAKYVYALYSGSSDFRAETKVFVFKWNGKHVKTFYTPGQSLITMAVAPSDKYLIGTVRNLRDDFEMVLFPLAI